MTCRGFIVAGTQTGVGKTTLAAGLMRAFADRGATVQPYKIGPDFIDPTHHRAAAGRWSHNLDSWMLDRETNRELFRRHAREADVAVVEGVMGLFDGAEAASDQGSTAQMARWLELPIVLVVDAWRLAGSVAPLVQGFAEFDPELEFAGVVLNRVAGPDHAEMLREALEAVDRIDVLGAVPRSDALEIPERHLGLHLAGEASIPESAIAEVAAEVGSGVDLEALQRRAAPIDRSDGSRHAGTDPEVRLGVARDEAFQFYYRDNFDRLERAGAEIVPFSPVAGEWPEDLDGLYLGGGYPEEFAAELASRRRVLDAICRFSRSRAPVYAECGGLMVLGRSLVTRGGDRFEMAGVFPWTTRIAERPHLDYAQVETRPGVPIFPARTVARGHSFHYSRLDEEPDPVVVDRVYEVSPVREEPFEEGYAMSRTLASYVHLHFGSQPELARSFVDACRAYRDERVS